MADLISMLAACGATEGEPTDPDFNQTVLLLHGDGTNGAQNNTFLDGSTNNFTITRNGNTTQGTFSPFSLAAGEWSYYSDGSGDALVVPSNAAFDLGSSDFTIECWFNSESFSSAFGLVSRYASTPAGWVLRVTSSTNIRFVRGADVILDSTVSAMSVNTWYHVAVVRNGSTLTVYLNGSQVGQAVGISNFTDATAATVQISATHTITDNIKGYISNVRIVKGTAVYTSNFTPPTTPLTNVTNTSLLTCQSNRFVDNSSNNFTITRNGDARVTPFSPFAPSAAYSASTNGGSGYFDGVGDFLTGPSNTAFQMGTGDFSASLWYYPTTSATTARAIFGIGGANGGSFQLFLKLGGVDNVLTLNTFAGSQAVTTGVVTVNAWNHIALSRSSGTMSVYLNGTRVLNSTYSDNLSQQQLVIGRAYPALDQEYVFGYISDFRLVKGTALFSGTTISVPTSPIANITNTSFLCNFTNAGIFDNTGKNNLETVGDAQIDTTTKKYGTGSMEFDGTGDWLLMAHNPDQQLGTGNFTIEFWVYLATGDIGSNRGLVAKGTSTTGFLVSLNTTEKVVFTFTTSTITSSGAITTNAWNHIAVVREGTGSNQTKIYIGGTNDGTGTVSTDFNQTSVMYVGCNRTAGDPMKGFIDDLRITKGVARYTAAFTPPTAAFPNE
jgi:hypothetical protein